VYLYHYKYGILLDKSDSNVLLVNLFYRIFYFIELFFIFKTAAYYRGAHVIVGVFDMNNLDTLKSAERWINEALEITAIDNPLIFLVGSKQDLIVNEIFLQLKYLVIFRQMIKLMPKLNK
jgi:hypothetical protein